MTLPHVERGVVFGAQHDASYDFWKDDQPRWKLCVAFNAVPATLDGEVLYFLCTSNTNFFREHSQFSSDVKFFAAGSYPFFPQETVLDFRTLAAVTLKKLIGKDLRLLGELSSVDIADCERIARTARILENESKWRIIPRQ